MAGTQQHWPARSLATGGCAGCRGATSSEWRRRLGPALPAMLMAFIACCLSQPAAADSIRVPWCTVQLPLYWKGLGGSKNMGHVHNDLIQVAQERNISIIPFPTPASALDWPNATTMETCRHIAFAPGVIDGLGSQYLRIMMVMAWAYINNVSYIHLVPEHMDHHTDIPGVERYFNLGHGEMRPADLPQGSTVCLAEHCGPDVQMMSSTLRPILLRKMRAGSVPLLPPLREFDPTKLHISVHIRRGDVMFRAMDILNHRWTADSYYVDVIRNVTRDVKTLPGVEYRIHMYSQGDLAEFENISKPLADQPLVWHLDEDEVTTLRGFICADIFIKGTSGLSGIGEWYSQGVIVHSNGWRPDANLYSRYWNTTTKTVLLSRLYGRSFIHAGC